MLKQIQSVLLLMFFFSISLRNIDTFRCQRLFFGAIIFDSCLVFPLYWYIIIYHRYYIQQAYIQIYYVIYAIIIYYIYILRLYILCNLFVVFVKSVGHILLLPPYRLQPTSLLCLWDFPGKNTGVGCHLLLQRTFLTRD